MMLLRLLILLLAVAATHWVTGNALYESALAQESPAVPVRALAAVEVTEEVSESTQDDADEESEPIFEAATSSSRSRVQERTRKNRKGAIALASVLAAVSILAFTATTLGYQMLYETESDAETEASTTAAAGASAATTKKTREAPTEVDDDARRARLLKKRLILTGAAITAAALLVAYQRLGARDTLTDDFSGTGKQGELLASFTSPGGPGTPESGVDMSGSQTVGPLADTRVAEHWQNVVLHALQEVKKLRNAAALVAGLSVVFYGLRRLARGDQRPRNENEIQSLLQQLEVATGGMLMAGNKLNYLKLVDVAGVVRDAAEEAGEDLLRYVVDQEIEEAERRVREVVDLWKKDAEKDATAFFSKLTELEAKLSTYRVQAAELEAARKPAEEILVATAETLQTTLKEAAGHASENLGLALSSVHSAVRSGLPVTSQDAVRILESKSILALVGGVLEDMKSMVEQLGSDVKPKADAHPRTLPLPAEQLIDPSSLTKAALEQPLAREFEYEGPGEPQESTLPLQHGVEQLPMPEGHPPPLSQDEEYGPPPQQPEIDYQPQPGLFEDGAYFFEDGGEQPATPEQQSPPQPLQEEMQVSEEGESPEVPQQGTPTAPEATEEGLPGDATFSDEEEELELPEEHPVPQPRQGVMQVSEEGEATEVSEEGEATEVPQQGTPTAPEATAEGLPGDAIFSDEEEEPPTPEQQPAVQSLQEEMQASEEEAKVAAQPVSPRADEEEDEWGDDTY
uniref:Megakaryocyte stimulating factor, putative n=1 Tax=Toxoplasma gondii (strain ATCC 50861 / VEG) TaxID=432359 RepID=A0A0F7V1J1_TOXGV|nr:TPA: megakaryocyte stimulating factor, putative [Toxoplasma gondii VEG]